MERERAFNRGRKMYLYHKGERTYGIMAEVSYFPLYVVKVIKELEKPLVEPEEISSVCIQLMRQN